MNQRGLVSIDHAPIIRDLSDADRAVMLDMVEWKRLAAGETLFCEGESADALYVLVSGTCMLSREAQPLREARRDESLDLVACLGGLAHEITAIAITDCEFVCWPLDELWRFEPFATAARRYLASALVEVRARLDELEAPVHYTGSAEVAPGPFRFDRVTMLIALCDADLDAVQAMIPAGLSLLRCPGLARGSVFLALAQFPAAYPEYRPEHHFTYDETTVFAPVRHGRGIGLFVPYIYPSAWEPILLGREIYGFPKRLGKTIFWNHEGTKDTKGRGDLLGRPYRAILTVDQIEQLRLTWDTVEPSGETRLVRALSDWIGIEGRVAAAAFRAGEVLREAARLPAYRRVDVYNRKRVLAPDATHDAPAYSLDCLTRATFGVLRWHEIARLTDPALHVSGGPLLDAHVTLREAYLTRLDMRLSTAQVVQHYTVSR